MHQSQPLFRTVVTPRPLAQRLGHADAVLSVGSCFSEHIAAYMARYRFDLVSNPSGILYNPLSISTLLRRLLSATPYRKEELFFHEGLFRSFDHHSRFARPDAGACLAAINESFERARAQLAKLDVLIVTLGTAFTYRLADTGRIVANCHKLSHERFWRELLDISTIIQEYRALLGELHARRPSLRVIATVSPVRHLRDAPHENQISKSHLLAALYVLEREFSFVHYFPSYEIMMDELRDYRFYDADMVHPSGVAIDYICRRFTEACISDESQRFIGAYAPVVAARAHRIQSTDRETIRRFAAQQLETLAALRKQFPMVSLREDEEYFSSLG